ncbi:SMC-Scp complex subunit ScpB [bacterium]|nr:SMC-Scp complex subunit ScpB [bacterium]
MNSADENEKNGLLAESGSAAGNEELLSGDESAAVSGTPKRANEAVKELARLNPVKRLAVLEAVLFMASEPLKADELQEALGWPAALLQQDLLALADTFAGRGIELSCSGGAWRLTTAPDTAPWVERFLKVESRRRLSRAQLETLSVIAYRQPVTRADIENYRGVRSDRALS